MPLFLQLNYSPVNRCPSFARDIDPRIQAYHQKARSAAAKRRPVSTMHDLVIILESPMYIKFKLLIANSVWKTAQGKTIAQTLVLKFN